MFEKISGFFKQFTSRRKRQSGETTIMESKEPGVDDFGLDDEFSDMDTFGDTGEFDDSAESVGAVSAQLDGEPGIDDVFSPDFESGEDDPAISTGGTDFDARTVSDEISGPAELGLEDSGADLAQAFEVGAEEPAPFESAVPEPSAASPMKTILIMVIALVAAIGAGVAFQLFAWPTVSKMVGLGGSEEVQVDPMTQLNSEKRKKANLQKELAEFKQVGGPAQVQELKKQIAEIRDTQGPMEEFESAYQAVKQEQAEYDELVQKVQKLETDVGKTRREIESVKVDIEQAKRRVVELARQTEAEYERFRFELVRAELGQRLLIELQLQDIESFKAEVAKLEDRLSKLSEMVLASAPTPEN